MKLGIFGGTFSPPHKGHVAAAACFRESFGLDRLLVVPAAVAPNKEGKDILPADHRVEMCRLAFEGRFGDAKNISKALERLTNENIFIRIGREI